MFVSAEWRHLAMLKYVVEPESLRPYVPAGTELDTWQGRHYVSVVGLMFYNTRMRNIAIQFHTTFEELNLRFYVRRKAADGWRRGVEFIREHVPKRAVASASDARFACPASQDCFDPRPRRGAIEPSQPDP